MFQNVRVKQRDGCTVYFQQGRVLCKVDGTAQTVPLFPAVAAVRLLMDKASGLKVRVVLEKQSQPFLDLQFSKEGDREAFALQLKQAKVQVKTEGGAAGEAATTAASSATAPTADTNGSSLLAGAWPVKLEDKDVSSLRSPTSKTPLVGHLDALFSGSDRRGVLSLYSVLDDWVDVAAMTAAGTSSTEPPQLKPLTDHMIADAFAAVPTLAAAHEILVTKRGLSEKEFWTAVVHKYLCFKATPLDSLVGTASGMSSSALTGAVSSPSSVGADSGTGAESYIRYINTSSQRPLRLVKGARRGREGDGEGAEDWADENNGVGTETDCRRLDNTKDSTDKRRSSGDVNNKRERTFTLLFGRCTQPFETPASLSWANPPLIRPAHTALTEYDVLVSTLSHIYFSESEGGGLATETAAALSAGPPNVESKDLWIQFWKSLDASDYSLAERLLSQAAAADAGRPHITKRAREVFEACRNAV